MFDLEQAIAEWRHQMLAADLKAPVPLNELESHLRDEIEHQIGSGLNAQEAFENAIQTMGEPARVKLEFEKIKTPSACRKLMSGISVALVGFILWMSGFTFSEMGLNVREQILAFSAVTLSLLIACGWRYAVPFLPIIGSLRNRMIVGLACWILGIISTSVFFAIISHFQKPLDNQIPAIGFWALFLIAAFGTLGLALMMGERERKHWGMGNNRHQSAT